MDYDQSGYLGCFTIRMTDIHTLRAPPPLAMFVVYIHHIQASYQTIVVYF